jgi:hypothetical protein
MLLAAQEAARQAGTQGAVKVGFFQVAAQMVKNAFAAAATDFLSTALAVTNQVVKYLNEETMSKLEDVQEELAEVNEELSVMEWEEAQRKVLADVDIERDFHFSDIQTDRLTWLDSYMKKQHPSGILGELDAHMI